MDRKINIIVKELGRISKRSSSPLYDNSTQKQTDEELLNKIAGVIADHSQNPPKILKK